MAHMSVAVWWGCHAWARRGRVLAPGDVGPHATLLCRHGPRGGRISRRTLPTDTVRKYCRVTGWWVPHAWDQRVGDACDEWQFAISDSQMTFHQRYLSCNYTYTLEKPKPKGKKEKSKKPIEVPKPPPPLCDFVVWIDKETHLKDVEDLRRGELWWEEDFHYWFRNA
ncbi:hypothetical protein OsI_28661 [Oryza sativa Indica Group]|uniref:Uncharacterized protein n=1 Tax=Oryza sativa subsp. indica TaxID=39946 RepID=B8B9A8_ORYSI|nr:hypothetical protein OsI_28661 [Oryza sativa Indica Group]